MLAKVRRPSSTPVGHFEIGRQQDHVGGGLCDAGRALDRQPDVSGLQYRCVVDAVAEEADDLAARV